MERRDGLCEIGSTGLWVSRFGLGCMSYGRTDNEVHTRDWTLGEEDSRAFTERLSISYRSSLRTLV